MITAIGLMSGTSSDAIDVAIIHSDGHEIELTNYTYNLPYNDEFRQQLKQAILSKKVSDKLIYELTELHAKTVNLLLKEYNLTSSFIDIIGFHGQTIEHRPDDQYTLQIGDGKLLAKLTNIDVINDFRSADVMAGGQGAPLVPIFHKAITHDEKNPVAILNLGGVGNITYINKNELIAFDTGPANALINDLIYSMNGQNFDDSGAIAATGNIHQNIIKQMLDDQYFKAPYPKSLDRDYFIKYEYLWSNLKFEDAIATLTSFSADCAAQAIESLPTLPKKLIIAGGGVHNLTMINHLKNALPKNCHLEIADNSDHLEAQAFGFLAIRSLYDLPITFPSTTGVKQPLTSGVLHKHC